MAQLRQVLLAAGVAACHGCSIWGQLWAPKVHNWSPDALPANYPSKIVVVLGSGAPTTAGLTLWAADGSQAADISCELTKTSSQYAVGDLPEVTCPTPALAVGTYRARFSSDRTCGASSYAPLDRSVDVVEPAHVEGASPSHGPEKAKTSVTISGSNFGGPHVNCRLTFPPAPGAKFGCSMTVSDVVATEVTPTSVVCQLPAWPGPVMKYAGSEGFKPLEGAACSRDVHVEISNDVRVYSQEPLVFHYDDTEQVMV